MKNELKYFFYVVSVLGFLIFIGSYYFSDKNKKNSYRSSKLYNNKIIKYKDDLITLENEYKKNPKIKIIKNSSNLGAGISRNIGIKHANGKIISFFQITQQFQEHRYLGIKMHSYH